MVVSKDLSENQHFLIGLMMPYIMGAEKQLNRVLTIHTCVKDPNRYTITQHYIFIYEFSSLLEHLNMIIKYRSNANLTRENSEQTINDFRNEIRHTGRFDRECRKRSERLGKNPNLLFELQVTDLGVKIGETNLSFKEIDLYIQQVKLELYSLKP